MAGRKCIPFTPLWVLFLFLTVPAQANEPNDVIQPPATGSSAPVTAEKSDNDFFSMSLEELMTVPIEVSGSLTGATRRLNPSTVTTITRGDIQRSGARSLYELMEIYVPNFQTIFHPAKLRHMGLRGIISQRDDKYLLLVNGRIMNESMDFGAMSERDLPMLTDINHIDVVRGPGSALYGPGALAMVINIITENANTYEGSELTTRLGAVEEFYSAEYKFGKKLDKDKGIFLYVGTAKYPGASTEHSPVVVGSGKTLNVYGQTFTGGDFMRHWYENYNRSFQNALKWKLHGQYTDGGFDLWVRYTQGGEYINLAPTPWATTTTRFWEEGEGYRQGTIYTSYKHDFTPDLSAKYVFSYDRMEVETEQEAQRPKAFREDEYFNRLTVNWNVHKNHKIAIGSEWSHMEYGFNINGWGQDEPVVYRFPGDHTIPRWRTNLVSLFGEYQWTISDTLTAFLGGRIDKHDYIEERMYSPRATLVYTPNEKDTIKIMASRSVRTNTAAEMKLTEDSGSDNEPERLTALELRYERQQTDALWLAGSVFCHSHDLLGYSGGRTKLLGNMNTYGLEAEISYRKGKTRIDFSHGFVKLIDMDMARGIPGTDVEETSEHMGFGSDLANWSNHISKLVAHHGLTDRLSLDGSVYIYWGSPGGEDYARYRYSTNRNFSEPGFYTSFKQSIFLNLGAEYKFNENFTVRVDGYNLLGMFDKNMNKRRDGFNSWWPAQYRVQPAAIGISLTYKF